MEDGHICNWLQWNRSCIFDGLRFVYIITNVLITSLIFDHIFNMFTIGWVIIHGMISCIWLVSDSIRSLKRFSKKKIKELEKEAQVMKERDIMKSLVPSACLPRVLCTCADLSFVGILLNCCLTCPLASILHTPLDESSAKFLAAAVILALEDLHKVKVFCVLCEFLLPY